MQSVADALEVVVVDDGSRAEDEVAEVVARHPRARLIRRTGAGPAAARNAGARYARGAVLCFTDDDCRPSAEWAQRLTEAIQRGADAAAGVTLSSGGALAEASEIVAHAPAAADGQAGEILPFAPSNNLACARSVFESIQFDESYPTAAGEDRDWCARLTAAGHVLRLEPAARVVHDQELTFTRFLRQQVRYGRGAFRFRRGSAERQTLEPLSFYAALLRRAFSESVSVGLLVGAAQLATTAGYALAWIEHRRDGRSITDLAA